MPLSLFVIFSFSGDAEIGKFYVRKGNGTAPGNHIIRMSPPPNENLKIDSVSALIPKISYKAFIKKKNLDAVWTSIYIHKSP